MANSNKITHNGDNLQFIEILDHRYRNDGKIDLLALTKK
jgi:hypothetical protein